MEEVNPERLLETAVVSMLRTLDPYTEYQVTPLDDPTPRDCNITKGMQLGSRPLHRVLR